RDQVGKVRQVKGGSEGKPRYNLRINALFGAVCYRNLINNHRSMGLCDGLSHCKVALAFAVLMDLLGGTALLVGVFAPLKVKGQDFGDLLVYTGALFMVASLAGWVLWYSGNIDGLSSRKELGHISSAVDRLARNLSRKIRSYSSHH
ncbi:unnamed protein product, partial [Menidia menidia]